MLARPPLPLASQQNTLTVSGFIETDQIRVGSELGGRIVALPYAEGSRVAAGDALVQLDDRVAQAELGVARARVAASRAALRKAQAGPRREAVYQAEAALWVAQATRDAARQNWLDAQSLITRQQTLDLQITQARWRVETTRHQLDAAVAALEAVKITTDRFNQPFEDYRYWQAWINVNTAGAAYDGAVATLAKLQAERAMPLAQRARANTAEAAYYAAEDAVAQARARLDDLRAGPTPEQIAVAQAQVAAAEAAAQAIQARIDKLTVRAPADGVVLEHHLHVGEIAPPTAAILTLAALDEARLVVYVPANRLGWVATGQPARVRVEGYAGRVFEGVITRIADKAEFIPNTVQSPEDRATQVYAVTIRLPNGDGALKPGLPADALLEAPAP
jgi:multidrug resistance efflux pump